MVNRYEAGAAGQTVESAQGSWAYAAGGSLAFCTDVALRAEGRSLFAVHRATRARSTPGAPLSAAVFSEELSKASAHVRSSFDQWLKQPGPIDVGTCLERAGYAVARPTYRGYTPRALALEILKVPSYDPLDLLVKKVVVGSAFLPGDMIRKLDGVPLFGTASIDWLLRDATPG